MSALDEQVGGGHYKDCKIQPAQYIEANDIRFLEGCVIKRCTRHNKPTGKGRQDIEKAIHELQLLLELRYPIHTTAAQKINDLPVFNPAHGARGCCREAGCVRSAVTPDGYCNECNQVIA